MSCPDCERLRAELAALRKSQADTEADWQAAVEARVRAERELREARALLARIRERLTGLGWWKPDDRLWSDVDAFLAGSRDEAPRLAPAVCCPTCGETDHVECEP